MTRVTQLMSGQPALNLCIGHSLGPAQARCRKVRDGGLAPALCFSLLITGTHGHHPSLRVRQGPYKVRANKQPCCPSQALGLGARPLHTVRMGQTWPTWPHCPSSKDMKWVSTRLPDVPPRRLCVLCVCACIMYECACCM